MIMEKEGPNDGLVSLASAKWVRTSSNHDDPRYLMIISLLGDVSRHIGRCEPSRLGGVGEYGSI